MKSPQGAQEDKSNIAQIREESEQHKIKVIETEASQSSLESRLKDLQEGAKSPKPSEEKVAVTMLVAKAVMARLTPSASWRFA